MVLAVSESIQLIHTQPTESWGQKGEADRGRWGGGLTRDFEASKSTPDETPSLTRPQF